MIRLLPILLLACNDGEHEPRKSILDTQWYVESEEVCIKLQSNGDAKLILDVNNDPDGGWIAEWESIDTNKVRISSVVVDGPLGQFGTVEWEPTHDGFYIIFRASTIATVAHPNYALVEGYAVEGCYEYDETD